MTETNRLDPDEALNWTALCYLLDELTADQHQAFEAQLATDQQAREAVAKGARELELIGAACHVDATTNGHAPVPKRKRPDGNFVASSTLPTLANSRGTSPAAPTRQSDAGVRHWAALSGLGGLAAAGLLALFFYSLQSDRATDPSQMDSVAQLEQSPANDPAAPAIADGEPALAALAGLSASPPLSPEQNNVADVADENVPNEDWITEVSDWDFSLDANHLELFLESSLTLETDYEFSGESTEEIDNFPPFNLVSFEDGTWMLDAFDLIEDEANETPSESAEPLSTDNHWG